MPQTFLTWLAAALVAGSLSAGAATPGPTRPIAFGLVSVDAATRSLSFPAWVNMDDLTIEYAVVARHGKTHESLLATEARPRDVHLGALLLGLKPSTNLGAMDQPLGSVPAEAAVEMDVAWSAGDREVTRPLHELVALQRSNGNGAASPLLSPGPWLYNGSLLHEGRFVAEDEGSIVSLIHDPAALVNNPRADRADDEIHQPNQAALPPKGTVVKVTLRQARTSPPGAAQGQRLVESKASPSTQATSSTNAPEAASLEHVNVFLSGQEGYHTFRIPAAVATARQTLLAFAEGRRRGAGDAGDIDLVLKRSTDAGRTWSPLAVVWDDGTNTCGNPCPVLDRDTGTLWLLMTWNRGEDREPQIIARTARDTRRVFVTHSRDDGLTWAPPREITADVKPTHWTWYATGPGAGIQLERGPHRGRLVIPCDHIEAETRHYYSHIIYSDDHGQTWRLGGRTPRHQVNECEVVELSDGRLLLNMRNYDRAQSRRQQASSADGGLTWGEQRHVPELPDPICQASIRRLAWPEAGQPGVILFSNPSSTRREKMTLWLSCDDGATWRARQELHAGPSAYSCLVTLPGRAAGCLYERGQRHPYESIVFARFPAAWLRAAEPAPRGE